MRVKRIEEEEEYVAKEDVETEGAPIMIIRNRFRNCGAIKGSIRIRVNREEEHFRIEISLYIVSVFLYFIVLFTLRSEGVQIRLLFGTALSLYFPLI